MLLDWVAIGLISSVLGGLLVIVDKVFVSRYSRDILYVTSFFGVLNFLPALTLLFFTEIFVEGLLFAILSGVFFRLAAFTYMKAISIEEASRVVPLFLLSPILVLVLERIFIGENLFLHHYVGIAAIILGSFALMATRVRGVFRMRPAFYVMMLSNIFFALSEIILKKLSLTSEFLPVIFWIYLGSFLASVPLLALKLKDRSVLFHKKNKLPLLISLEVFLFFIVTLTYWYAVSLGPVSLVSAVGSVDGLFVFIFGIFLTRFAPSIIREAIDRKTLLMKALAISLIIVGVLFINGGI